MGRHAYQGVVPAQASVDDFGDALAADIAGGPSSMLNMFNPDVSSALSGVAGSIINSAWSNPVAGTCLVLVLLELVALAWLDRVD